MLFLLAAALTYTGNESCRPCHQALYDHYLSTPMARSSGRVNANVTPGIFEHKPSHVRYTIDGEGKVTWAAAAQSGQKQLEYFIGSGAAGRSYLFTFDGFLFQAPVTWYAQHKRWDVSPGYEADKTTRWSRPIEANCLFCHASQTRAIYGTQNRYAGPPFAQGGVGCERCHGPGSEHIRGRGPMVSPAKLAPSERDSVCSQCHLSGAARIEKLGKRIAAFRAGEDLNDYVAYFVDASAAGGDMKATSHMERLEASGCKRASGDKLWCGTCHHPHKPVSAASSCATCHAGTDCKRGADCTACHMPKTRVVDGGHGVLTDHSIPRKSGRYARSNGRLTTFRSFTATNRELGLAYAEVNRLEEARKLLSHLPRDAATMVRLNEWEAALRSDPNSVVAMVNLGVLRARSGDLAAAESLWRRSLERNPGQMEAATNLHRLLEATGRLREAAELLDQIRRFEPQFVQAPVTRR
jgi:tetratricopeptide (TPR) repeat protein